MILNLFNKDEGLEFHYGSIAKLIQEIRSQHLNEGGDPLDFPKYLEDAGVRMDGPLVVITDQFALMAKVKYGK